jgi:hypothetical protein
MKNKLFSVIFACTFVFCVNAQQAFTNYAVGIDGGTYGFGVWGATNLSPNFVLKAGFNYFGFKVSESLNIEDMDGYVQGTDDKVYGLEVSFGQPRLRIPHGKLIAEWYPNTDGAFSLAFGTYIGVFDIIGYGQVKDYEQRTIDEGGPIVFRTKGLEQELIPRADGSFDGRIRVGNVIKPYVGIGFGRSIPKNNIGFKFDLGVTYQGNMRFISEQGNIDDLRAALNSDDVPVDLKGMNTILDIARFWPVLNFSLSYKF